MGSACFCYRNEIIDDTIIPGEKSFDSGVLFRINGYNKYAKIKTDFLAVNNFSQVAISNITLSYDWFSTYLILTGSNVNIKNLIFDYEASYKELYISFEKSNVTCDFKLLTNQYPKYKYGDAEHVIITDIPKELTLNDANGKYPYINWKLLASSYEWIGPSEETVIIYKYGEYEKADEESYFIINEDASILIENYDNGTFLTNLIFITNDHHILLDGIDFIPENLFSNISDVSLCIDPSPNISDEVQASSQVSNYNEIVTSIGHQTQKQESQSVTKQKTKTPSASASASDPIQTPLATQSPEPSFSLFIVSGLKDKDGIHVENIISKPGNMHLVGGIDNKPDYSSNLHVENIEIPHLSKVESVPLIIEKSISIKGDSVLKPSDRKRIDFDADNTVEITFESVNGKLPLLDLGELGSKYDKKPKSFKIKLDTSKMSDNQIQSIFGNGKVLVSGETLNCDEWLAKTNLIKITGNDGFTFSLKCENINSKLLDYVQRNMVLKADKIETPKKKSNMLIIIIASVAAVVVIIVIIIVVFFVCKRIRREESTSSCSTDFIDQRNFSL